MKKDANKNILLKATLDTGAQKTNSQWASIVKCANDGSIIIDNNDNNESNGNSNCLQLLLLRMFYNNNKNLY